MFRVVVYVAALAFLQSGATFAASLPDEKAAEKLASDAMAQLGTKGVRGVFESVAPYWDKTHAQLEAIISDSESKREGSAVNYGKYLGYEKLIEKKAGSSIMIVTMIEKTEKRGIVWYFSYYKPKDTWILYSCYWNQNFEGLLLLTE